MKLSRAFIALQCFGVKDHVYWMEVEHPESAGNLSVGVRFDLVRPAFVVAVIDVIFPPEGYIDYPGPMLPRTHYTVCAARHKHVDLMTKTGTAEGIG